MAKRSEQDRSEPSLELPSLGLPRLVRRRPKASAAGGPVDQEDAGASGSSADSVGTAEPDGPAQPERGEDPTVVLERATPVVPAPTVDGATRDRLVEPVRRRRSRRQLPGPLAAVLTGLAVAVFGGAVTFGALAGCEAVRGVSTCGEGPGLLILLAIVVAMVVLGALLLKLSGVQEANSTSFLAVGIVTVVVMLFLLDVVMSPWMFLVIPLLTAGAYLLAHWVTTSFADEDTGRRDWR